MGQLAESRDERKDAGVGERVGLPIRRRTPLSERDKTLTRVSGLVGLVATTLRCPPARRQLRVLAPVVERPPLAEGGQRVFFSSPEERREVRRSRRGRGESRLLTEDKSDFFSVGGLS